MNGLTTWLSPLSTHSLGWSLLHFLWQGTAVAALAAVLMEFCRRASTRYVLAVGALLVMVLAPVATFLSLAPLNSAFLPASYLPADKPAPIAPGIAAGPSSIMMHLSPSLDPLPWLVEAWLMGVALLSLRSAGGFLLLEGQRRRQTSSAGDQVLLICHTLQRRLGLDRHIRYRECNWLQVPAVIGWFRPIVLLPVSALTGLSEEQLLMIVAHELAHIQRFDAFVNVFQIAVEILLFYHPAVWWLNRRIRTEREHCCDDIAVSLFGNPVEYARTLTLMEGWRTAPALAMAANRGPLRERIFRLLGLRPQGAANRYTGLVGGILCLTAALAAGNQLRGIAYPKFHAGAASLTQVSLAHFGSTGATRQSTPVASPSPMAATGSADKPSPVHSQGGAQPPASSGSYIDAMKAAGLGNLTVDDLIAMKIHNITPEYVREIRALGINPSTDEIVTMKIHNIDADYIRGLKEAGLQPNADESVALKVHGATAAYMRAMREQGLQANADELVSMKIHNVTPEFVRDIRALGFKPTVDEVVTMQIHGVTPDFISSLQTAGFKFDIDDAVSAKIQGVTKEFIESAAKRGFKDLTLDKLIELKRLGVLESPTEI
jgi:beta-lactamase regulating signal transducer with metallopeptidase domain